MIQHNRSDIRVWVSGDGCVATHTNLYLHLLKGSRQIIRIIITQGLRFSAEEKF